MTWELLWKVFFVLVLTLFAVMSVLVTIFGARDVKRLLRGLGEEEGEHSRPPDRDVTDKLE